MELGFALATVLGAGPALLTLYYVLREYQGGWVDQKLFICLAVGMILGVVGFFFHAMLDNVVYSNFAIAFLVYVLGFAALENLMPFAVLNFKWLRGKPDATFYGVSLGAGFAASGAMAFVYRAASVGVDFIGAFGLASLIIISFATIFLRIACGAMVGAGAARSEPWGWFLKAVLVQMPYSFLFMGLLVSAGPYTPVWVWVPLSLAMLGYTYFLLYYVRRRVLPEHLPGGLKKKMRRDRRQRGRAVGR